MIWITTVQTHTYTHIHTHTPANTHIQPLPYYNSKTLHFFIVATMSLLGAHQLRDLQIAASHSMRNIARMGNASVCPTYHSK